MEKLERDLKTNVSFMVSENFLDILFQVDFGFAKKIGSITLAPGLFPTKKSKRTHWEVIVIIQARNNCGLAHAGGVKLLRICQILNTDIF